MAIKMQNRIDPTFSATSMSDLVFHNLLISKISNVVYMLEVRTTEFMDLLHENA